MAKRPALPTRHSTPRLSEAARHLILPRGIVSTGWPAVQKVLSALQVDFDAWQVGAASAILGKRADGQYAADTVVISIPRQVGKTFLLGCIVFALCILNPGLLVIWTAHHTRTSDETFSDLRAIAALPKAAPHVKATRAANGQQGIIFRNGSRILFGAREQGFGRGFKKVGVLVLDEAQILSESAMDNLVPTTNQAANPLILLAGTPPRPRDPGDVFTNLRNEAIEAGSGASDSLYIEFSADADAELDDRAQWAKANPSYPKRTKARAILRLLKHLGPASFRREALGIWDATSVLKPVIDPSAWDELVSNAPHGSASAIGVKFSPDGARQCVSVSAPHDVGGFVEVIGELSGSTSQGLAPLVDWIAERASDIDAVVIDGKSLAGALNDALLDAGVNHRKVIRPTLDQVISANAGLLEAVTNRTVAHSGQPGLAASIATSIRRPIGTSGGWGFQPMTDDDDSTPTESAALALYWLGGPRNKNGKRKTGRAVF